MGLHGHCAVGLSCLPLGDPPKLLLLGTTSPGVCTSHEQGLNTHLKHIMMEAVQMLNTRVNSAFMLVPVAVHGVHQEKMDGGDRKYDFTVSVQASNCLNDGQHTPKDVDCKPATGNEAETFNLLVMETEGSSSYHLVSFSKVGYEHRSMTMML